MSKSVFDWNDGTPSIFFRDQSARKRRAATAALDKQAARTGTRPTALPNKPTTNNTKELPWPHAVYNVK